MSLTRLAAEARAAAANPEHPWDRAAIDWPALKRESIVVEVGGYKGRWALQIAQRYNPRLYVYEPQHWAVAVCRAALTGYEAQVFPFGLGDHDGHMPMRNYETDGCAFADEGEYEGEYVGQLRDAARNLPKPIALMLVNIEGYEYTLLPYMLDKGLLPARLMVQWHTHAASGAAHDALLARLDAHYGGRLWDYGPVLMAWGAKP